MTDYELASLFGQYLSILQDRYINYTTVLFALLMVSYFAAHRLKLFAVVLIVSLFTAYSIDSMIGIILVNNNLGELAEIINERISNGSLELAFHGGTRGDLDPNTYFLQPLRFFVLIGGYLGAILFFYFKRKEGLSN